MGLERETNMLIGAVVYDAIVLSFLLAVRGIFWENAFGTALWLILLLGVGIVPWLNRLKRMLKS